MAGTVYINRENRAQGAALALFHTGGKSGVEIRPKVVNQLRRLREPVSNLLALRLVHGAVEEASRIVVATIAGKTSRLTCEQQTGHA
jgi:hypothetical protein